MDGEIHESQGESQMSLKILFLGGIVVVVLIAIGLVVWGVQAFIDRDS